ncbi:hypothetical protein A6A25_24500 [Saccharothrix sp. CB00851]|nr:hypothetical protein A6A25_24500 [Saccharothrix sp. CB00851]
MMDWRRECSVMSAKDQAYAVAWHEAVAARRHLSTGGVLAAYSGALPPGVTLPEQGEHPLGVFSAADLNHYARHTAEQVEHHGGGSTMVVGPPSVVAGFVIGSVVRNAAARRRAHRQAAPQWRPAPLLWTAVTSRRLWCQSAGSDQPRWFNFDMITGVWLERDLLTVRFRQGAPLQLGGPRAPWLAAVVAATASAQRRCTPCTSWTAPHWRAEGPRVTAWDGAQAPHPKRGLARPGRATLTLPVAPPHAT